MKRFIPLVAFASVFAAPAHASTVVDVNNLVVGTPSGGWYAGAGISGGVPFNRSIAQTWTVQTGGLLSQLDLFASASTNAAGGSGHVNFYTGGSVDTKGTTLVGSLLVPLSSFSTTIQSIDVSSLGINVNAGDVMTFELVADPCGATCPTYWYNQTNLANGTGSYFYAGGSLFDSVNGRVENDLNFRTFVSTSVSGAVPEPATWALMIIGFGAAGTAMRRRQKVRVSFA